MTARNPRICADCRHCEQRRTLLVLTEEYCSHPKAVDLVTGKAVWRARQLRDPGSRLCGASGRLWEAPVSAGEHLANVHKAFPAPVDERVDGYGMPDPGTYDQLKQMAGAIGSPGAAAVLATVAPFAKAIKEARE